MSAPLKKNRLDYNFGNKYEEPDKDTSFYRPYLDFYNLKKPPFTITPDPEFLYSSSTHKTAIENILYGIEACMGFMLLIGEVGTGKTTICRTILDKLEGNAETVYIINPSLSGLEIIQTILDDLGLEYPVDSSKKALLDRLNNFLLKATTEKPVVIIIDDAQTMTPEGLENLRLLSNLETDKKKLLQLVLVGQPELQTLLSQPELRQLKQRITICCQLDLINYAELKQYISLRLYIAGDNGKVIFTEAAIREIHKASQGVPRLINIICDYVLIAGYTSNTLSIKKIHARKAINELRYQSFNKHKFLSKPISGKRIQLELLALIIGLLVLVFSYNGKLFDDVTQSTAARQKNEAVHNTDNSPSTQVNDLIGSDVIPVAKSSEDPSLTEDKLPDSEAGKSPIIETSKNYIIQISSIKTLKAANSEGMSLRHKNIDVHWNPVHLKNKGTWYRIYKGGFSTKEEAMSYKQEKGIEKGIIIYAPWTIVVTSRERTKTYKDVFDALQEKGIDCIIESRGEDYRVISGAFRSFERAQKAAQEILDMGFDAKPIQR